ncbi:hypothetical protein ACH4U6_25520 [Streptomyces netropsis]|uniref:hypothetical protein n=1 Tax=Streptomyces netropsis TaxID=55404 RepID=UPI0037B73994
MRAVLARRSGDRGAEPVTASEVEDSVRIGQWGWLEENTGLKMAAAFADLLTRGDGP